MYRRNSIRFASILMSLPVVFMATGKDLANQGLLRNKFSITESRFFTPKDTLPSIAVYLGNDAKPLSEGVLPIYKKDGKTWMVVPHSILNRDILQAITILKGAAVSEEQQKERFGYAGDIVFEQLIKIKKLYDRKISIFKPPVYTSSSKEYVPQEFVDEPVDYMFNIVAEDQQGSLIDITSLYTGDSHLFSLKGASKTLKLGMYQPDRSYNKDISGDSTAMTFRSVRSYAAGATDGRSNNSPKQETIWEIGSSWYILPLDIMKKRFHDPRVGYFTGEIQDHNRDDIRTSYKPLVRRWRLEPRPEDVTRYTNGELVEPQKPIIFYVDKNFPEDMVPYIIDGINAWQKSFEKIGFKNAIIGVREPMTSPEKGGFAWDDIRYSAISFKASPIPNAYGPMVIDPRSGEIISSHVAIYHNIFDVLQRWYYAVCSPLDKRAQRLPFESDLMGALIRNVVTHEVGHTLGLRHNFSASAHYTTDSLRNADFVRKNGLGASIMDYIRFNQVAQPEDNMPVELLLPQIGVYDDFAIAWGYKLFDKDLAVDQETTLLRDWTNEYIRSDERLRYIEESELLDPTTQKEDIGKDIVKASSLAIENLKRSMLLLRQYPDQEDYMYTRQMYMTILSKYQLFIEHGLKLIGGKLAGTSGRDESADNYTPIPVESQREALAFAKEHFIKDQSWLYPEEMQRRARFYYDKDVIERQEGFVSSLLVKPTLIVRNQQMSNGQNYAISEYLEELTKAFFAPTDIMTSPSTYTMSLQRVFVNRILALAANPANVNGDVSLYMKKNISYIADYAAKASENTRNEDTSQHFKSITKIINSWNKN